jgi:hypothetical protein
MDRDGNVLEQGCIYDEEVLDLKYASFGRLHICVMVKSDLEILWCFDEGCGLKCFIANEYDKCGDGDIQKNSQCDLLDIVSEIKLCHLYVTIKRI